MNDPDMISYIANHILSTLGNRDKKNLLSFIKTNAKTLEKLFDKKMPKLIQHYANHLLVTSSKAVLLVHVRTKSFSHDLIEKIHGILTDELKD